MKKRKNRTDAAKPGKGGGKLWIPLTAGAVTALLVVLLLFTSGGLGGGSHSTEDYRAKADLLRERALTEDIRWELGLAPAGQSGFAVFISVCDTTERASVFAGTGKTLDAAWEAADSRAETALRKSGLSPVWVKADLVYLSEIITMEELYAQLRGAREGSFRYGLTFDSDFDTALLEAELNSAGLYVYGEEGIDLTALNRYLKEAGRARLKSEPDRCMVFQCVGWLCDEESRVYMLDASGLDYGRRQVELVDAAYAEDLISGASAFLAEQVKEDGSFVYGLDPRFDEELEGYNIVRHADAIWSLICRYRVTGDEELAALIDRTIEYMLSQVVYEDDDTAYLYEARDDEIKLGGCGVAIIAMTEYMDAFQNDKYEDVCRKLGNGILNMLDQETGEYYHVLGGDFSRKEEFRTVYYDGEATFALCRLYGLTGEQVWLNAAQSAVDHFIEADYTQYKDHWVAYTMNEITKHVPDNPDYYLFALQNVQKNVQEIYEQDTTYHTYLELLMATFELYDRMMEGGAEVAGFDLEMFLRTIYARADRMLNGYFYPEYAMYMENPQRILNAFMVRHDGYRVRIDDVQHNIGGYYLYYKHYDKLVEYGMLDYRD